MFFKQYFFGKNEIKFNDFYEESRGYGFVNFDKIDGETDSYKALNAGNWNHRPSDGEGWKKASVNTDTGVKLLEERQALIFQAKVSEFGSYKVTLKISADENINNVAIFTGRRNLVARNIEISKDEVKEFNFYTYVTPYIPALTYIPKNDKYIFISILGKNVVLKNISITEEKVKTIFIAGDSTLTDQNAMLPYYPICSCAGWAQDLLAFTPDFAVCNYAHSGLTTNCFKDDGHFDILKNQIKPGDIFMIQFGHNDQKRRNLMPFGGYMDNLRWYVHEVRKLGAFPIICSPISRIPIKDEEETYSLLAPYALACKEAAKECKVPFIDLHEFTFNEWISMNENDVKNYFIPGDITHTNDYGAIKIADYVATKLLKIKETSSFIKLNKANIITPDYDTLDFPKEAPDGKSVFDIDMPFMDLNSIKKLELCKQAFKKGLMDPCVMNIHPNETMARGQFLMIYLRAIRLNGTRPYLGKYCDFSKYDWDSSFAQTCINEDLIDETTTSNNYFRPCDPITYGEFASFLMRGIESKEKRKSITINLAINKAKDLNIIDKDKNTDEFITRENIYAGLSLLMDLIDNSNKDMPSDTEMHPVH